MNTDSSSLSRRRASQPVLAALVCCGVALVFWSAVRFWSAGDPPETAAERTSAELIRQAGALWEKSTQRPFTGWLVERYPEGSLRSRSWLSNGVLSGISEGWHTNGVLQIQEHFLAGVSEGPVTRWRDDGSKVSEGVAQAGKLEGWFRRWHTNGQMSEEVTLRVGEPFGLSRSWFPSGSLQAEVRLDAGRVVTQHFWKDGDKDGRNLATVNVSSP